MVCSPEHGDGCVLEIVERRGTARRRPAKANARRSNGSSCPRRHAGSGSMTASSLASFRFSFRSPSAFAGTTHDRCSSRARRHDHVCTQERRASPRALVWRKAPRFPWPCNDAMASSDASPRPSVARLARHPHHDACTRTGRGRRAKSSTNGAHTSSAGHPRRLGRVGGAKWPHLSSHG